ncbi:hypothetical protein [Rhizobium sp. Root149]|uniref:hypothetical protein n=1 Tax=Rhizobium sp. Root149 TaxID=1736473 RepID=UPI000A77E559|nr:hypothetical protein [Rhizobium sp. Root149]
MAQPDQRMRRVRRNNWIVFAIFAAFVVAVFSYSFVHIGREARPDPAVSAPARP